MEYLGDLIVKAVLSAQALVDILHVNSLIEWLVVWHDVNFRIITVKHRIHSVSIKVALMFSEPLVSYTDIQTFLVIWQFDQLFFILVIRELEHIGFFFFSLT